MPDFRLINYRITYVWSGVFFVFFLSSYFGKEKPAYAIVIPFALCIGIGVVFSKKYPDFYLKRKYRVRPEAAAAIPDSVDKLIEGMPNSFNPAAARDLRAEIQFDISGEGGGRWVISIAEGRCQVRRGEAISPALTIESSGEVWVKIARGEIDRPKALMQNLYRVKGDVNILARMPQIFGTRRSQTDVKNR
jgi:putative sterol carrier protein